MTVVVVPNQAGIEQVIAAGIAYRDRLTEEMADDMRRYSPVLTGDLCGTIRTDLGGPVVARIWAGDVAAGIDWHLYNEFGTSRMDPQPYIRPAVYQYRGGR